MIESGLFFTLGFLCSAFLALMVAPAIWRRAVYLTRQKIESSIPLTLNEIQADKDQLRAEFAMSTRRLEVSLEQLKETAAEQMVEIGRRRNEAQLLEDEHSSLKSEIEGLQAQSEELRSKLREREDRLDQANKAISITETRLESRAVELESLDRRHREALEELDSQKIELVSRETRLDSVHDDIRELKDQLRAMRDERNAVTDQKKALESERERDKQRLRDAEDKLDRQQTNLSDMEARLERRNRDLAKAQGMSKEETSRFLETETKVQDLQAENIRLAAELAESAMRMEALVKDASGENIDSAVAMLEDERSELRRKLEDTEADRDALQVQLSAMELSSGDNWEQERQENAIVRERINDLAAQVAAMTAALEGDDSPIHSALAASAGDHGSDDGAGPTLADRIRKLQAAAQEIQKEQAAI